MSREDDLKRVNWDPDLHRYHKEHGRWDKWIQSPEYGRAFRAYWKKGTVPWRIYPKALIQKNSREGTVTHLPLEGYRDWKDTEKGNRAYRDFMCTAIYNRELAEWCRRQRQAETSRRKRSSRQSGNHLFSLRRSRVRAGIVVLLMLIVICFTYYNPTSSFLIPIGILLILSIIGAKIVRRKWMKNTFSFLGIALIILGICLWGSAVGFIGNIPSDNNTSTQNSLTNITSPIAIPTTSYESYKTNPVTKNYNYIFDGSSRSISAALYPEYVDKLSKKSHSYYSSVEKEIISPLFTDEGQDIFMEPLIKQLNNLGSGDKAGKIAISLVQSIPYDYGKFWGRSMDWYYPYETLYHNKGVCSDKSILLAYLLKNLGYDIVLFEFSDHMAIGVKIVGDGFRNTEYAFIETTVPTIITYEHDTYVGTGSLGALKNTYHISDGGKTMNVHQEMIDATELKRLDGIAARNNNHLSESEYSQWQRLVNKYGLMTS